MCWRKFKFVTRTTPKYFTSLVFANSGQVHAQSVNVLQLCVYIFGLSIGVFVPLIENRIKFVSDIII